MTNQSLENKETTPADEQHECGQQCASYVRALEQRNQELERLLGLGTLLQSCLAVEEAHDVISRTVRKLFVAESGAVYLYRSRPPVLAPVAAWGDFISPSTVVPEAAGWSLVEEHSVPGDERSFPVLCPDDGRSADDASFCAPIVGQYKTLGMVYVRLNGKMLNELGQDRQAVIDHKKQLAVTVAEIIALFITNIQTRETLYSNSIRDPLTGLLNRRPMQEYMEKEIMRTMRKKLPLGVVMIDIDHFKKVNDTHGHGAGDVVLREFGAFFRKQIRGGDFACRYGGEEFLLVLPESSLENVVKRAEQIRSEARSLKVRYFDRELESITLSLGVAEYPEHGQTHQELLLAADAALYQAKSAGRDRITIAGKDAIAEHALQSGRFQMPS